MNINKAFDLINQEVTTWIQQLIRLLPSILVAAVVLALGLYAAKWVKKIAMNLISRVSANSSLNKLFTDFVYIFFITVVVFIVLSILHLDTAVTSVLAGAGILGLAMAFAFQDIAANFISGIFISFRRPIHVGDVVKIKGYMGKIAEINLRDTVIRTSQGQMVIIPNKDVFQSPIENFTLFGKRRVDLRVGVSYGEDLEFVKQITLDAVKDIKNLSAEDKTTLFYKEFGDSSINFTIRLWGSAPDQTTYNQITSDAIMRIKAAYDQHNIMIPFPIQTLDFGIKGGVPLSDMVANDAR